jgi:hypothetical protein
MIASYALLLLSALLSFNATLIFLNFRAWRRQLMLNCLLQDLCFRAWSMQHYPIWHAWSEMTGISLEIRPRIREELHD